MITPTLKQEISQLEANLCSAFAEPTRILILYALNEQPHNVKRAELMNSISLSRQLRVNLGFFVTIHIVRTRRQGTSITYELRDRRLIEALDILRAVLRDGIALKANLVAELDNQV